MKKSISILLSLILLCTVFTPVSAEDLKVPPANDETITQSVEAIKEAVKNLEKVFDNNQSRGIMEALSEFGNAFKAVTSYAAAINSGVTFLKLIGVIKDGSADALKNIMAQMTVITEQLTEMDRKLDRITEKMNEIQASSEFNSRSEKAILYEKNWKDFQYRYMEQGMDNLMTQYNSMMLTGLQLWCTNEGNARTANSIDNSKLLLCYEKTGDGYKLIYTIQNGRPDGLKDDARVIELGSDILPQSLAWNVNTYRETIKNEIIRNLKNKEGFDPALIEQTAEDAVNLLIYRVTASRVNANSEFSLQVQRQFANYCTHLVTANEGIDAVAKAMYFTHAFEFQIREDYTDFMDQMIVKSGVYGMFVLNVLGMSNYVTDAEKNTALDLYCSTVLSVEKKKIDGLTGSDNYCYITNKNLCFGTISFTDNAEIKTKNRGSVRGYEDYKAGNTEVSISYGRYSKSCDPSQLIGDTDAILLGYYLNGVQGNFGYDFFNEKLGQRAAKDCGATVVSLVGQQSLPTNNSSTLSVTNVIGSYFNGVGTTKLSSLPSSASTSEIVSRKMMNGSLMNTSTGSITSNNVLSAIAVYGESHWYWEKDEAAFLGGPSDIGAFTKSSDTQRSGTDFPATEYFTTTYKQTVTYNCLVNEEKKVLLGSSGTSDTLKEFAELCEEIRSSVTPEVTESEGFKAAYVIIIPAAVLVVGGAAAFVILRKKNKAKSKK